MNLDVNAIHIFTDGACSGNPGPGGWGCVMVSGSYKKAFAGSDPNTTNNRMELQAVLEGLRRLKDQKKGKKIIIYSDSAYLINGFTQGWVSKWVKNDWYKDAKKTQPVLNQVLWEELWMYANQFPLEWVKVKGHSDHLLNNLCDKMAVHMIGYQREVDSALE